MTRLPIDDILPGIREALENSPSLVIEAPPGAGKTTRVPLAILNSPFLGNRKIVMLEPRRLAAANAARWMASCLGEDVGRTVGYTIRFERKVSAETRIEVVTEGVLTRRLQDDPLLQGTGVVIFDEFHERSLNADTALALCLDVQQGLRNDLKIIVMSATLDGGPVARLLGDAPVVTSQGKIFPVRVSYLLRDPEGRCAEVAARAVLKALAETEGDILLFLPGGGEIRRCRKLLEEGGGVAPVILCPLYGDLPYAEQERAIMPADRRKVVLATNIAETSLTIEGVRVVIDAGWSRQLRYDPATGLNRLVTVRLSSASAAQRAGRSGRLGPGTCFRLWTEHTQNSLVPFTPPEILTSDLCPLALDLALWGVADAASLSWLDPPPAPALNEGRRLLVRLGALDAAGRITPHGKAMAVLPVHPRLSHMLLAAQEREEGSLACDLAALLGERDIFIAAPPPVKKIASDSDLLDRVEALARWRGKEAERERQPEIDGAACRTVDRTAAHLRRLMGIKALPGPSSSGTIGLLLSKAYPDRIARQREPGSDRYLLTNGRGGSLSPRSALHDAPFLVAVNMEGGERGDGLIHLASALSLDMLRSEHAADIKRLRVVEWDRLQGRVVACEEERLGSIILASRPFAPSPDELRDALIRGIAGDAGLDALKWSPEAEQFRTRTGFLARLFPGEGWPDLSDEALLSTLEEWLGPSLAGLKSLSDLAGLDILPSLRRLLTWQQAARLDEGAPTHIRVPSGSRVPLQYPTDGPPVLAVKLQELFGLADTPTVAWGRVPVVLHLLSPARRPVQVTQDLKGFWNSVYPEVKKELKGRYPRHPWPDDPWQAVPTRHVKRRG
jgi:ATP-dependent helicase HrpB